MARRIKAGIKRSATDLASNQFPKCSPHPGTHKKIHRVGRGSRGMEEIEATWWRKRKFKWGREQSSQ